MVPAFKKLHQCLEGLHYSSFIQIGNEKGIIIGGCQNVDKKGFSKSAYLFDNSQDHGTKMRRLPDMKEARIYPGV